MALVPNKFPDGTQEVYGYDAISLKDNRGQYVLSKENKRHNADSYAYVATGRPPAAPEAGIPLTSVSYSMVQPCQLCSVGCMEAAGPKRVATKRTSSFTEVGSAGHAPINSVTDGFRLPSICQWLRSKPSRNQSPARQLSLCSNFR